MKLTKLKPAPKLIPRKRVAAYARVSSGKDAMHHSLSAQISYYNSLIQSHKDWEFVKVYADEAITGTKSTRAEFQKLISDCKAGKVDLILTKSISRFARNTVDLLNTIRALKEIPVDVFFEEQNIHTLSGEGELMLTILASFAQEEARSVSENMKWRIKKNFEEGKPWHGRMLGYRYENGKYVINEYEAGIVRKIFADYLSGMGLQKISNNLSKANLNLDYSFGKTTIRGILTNYAYTGNLMLQTTYVDNYITKKKMENNGELPKYHVEASHEPIISEDDYNAVQEQMLSRTIKYCSDRKKADTYPLSGKIYCDKCKSTYRHKVCNANKAVWICATYNTKGKAACPSKAVPCTVMDSLTTGIDGIEKICVKDNNLVDIYLKNGEAITKEWKDRSRAESWTPEMREKARQRELERNIGGRKCQK